MSRFSRNRHKMRRRIYREYVNVVMNNIVEDFTCYMRETRDQHIFRWKGRHQFTCSCGKKLWWTKGIGWQTAGYKIKEELVNA